MAILRSHGVLLVDSIPVYTPTAEQARLARLEDTGTFYYYDGSAWQTLTLDNSGQVDSIVAGTNITVDATDPANPIVSAANAPVTSVFGRTGIVVAAASDYDDSQIDLTYTPTNFTPTNAFVDGALEGLDNAFGALVGDGNDTPIIRGNATQGVEPTPLEVPSPVSGDTASIYLSDGVLEKWLYTTSWALAYTLPAPAGTNLAYTASPTNGTITSDTGSDAVIPLADGTNAGLLSPAGSDKLGFITVTQAVDLDAIEAAALAAIQTVTDTNSIDLTKTGSDLTADLRLSGTQTGVTVTIESDGLSIVVDDEVEPTGYLSRAAATIALGAGAKFQYLAANLDGAVEGTVAWT